VYARIKRFFSYVIFQIVWSVFLSLLTSFVLILFARGTDPTKMNVDYIIMSLYQLFPVLFALAFSFLFAGHIVKASGRIVAPQSLKRIELRVRNLSLERRLLLDKFLNRSTIILLFVILAIAALLFQEIYTTDTYGSSLIFWFLAAYGMAFLFKGCGDLLMNEADWALFYIEDYQKTMQIRSLEKGLKHYNKIIGSTLSIKKLAEISQCVNEAFKIGNDEDIQKVRLQIERIKGDLGSIDVQAANANLIDLSNISTEITREHRDKLGFEFKYSYRLRLLEHTKNLLSGVFPEFMKFLLWVAILLVLAYLGWRHIIFPPT